MESIIIVLCSVILAAIFLMFITIGAVYNDIKGILEDILVESKRQTKLLINLNNKKEDKEK